MKGHQITIVDIAKQLGISKSTVSRVLTDHPNVSEKTKTAVLELAKKLDYQRNMSSIKLLTQKSNTLGIVIPEFISSYFPQIITSVQEVATAAGYNLLICHSNEKYETEVANTKMLLANQVDGVLISITKETQNTDHLKIFQRKGIPIVMFNRVCNDISAPKVIVDDYEGAFKAVEHLIKRGKKRIAHLAGPSSLLISLKRLDGYKAALSKYDIAIDESIIIPYDLTLSKVSIYLEHLLRMDNPPDALFAINDPTAIEAIRVVKKNKLRIPQDISIVGFSDDFASSLVDPPLTTISQPTTEIGNYACKMLIDQIDRDVSQWKSIIKVLPTELIIRESS